MTDWGSVTFAFSAIAGGIVWVLYFGYELSTLEPPMPAKKVQTLHKVQSKKAA